MISEVSRDARVSNESNDSPPDSISQTVRIIIIFFAKKNNYWLTHIFYLIYANLI